MWGLAHTCTAWRCAIAACVRCAFSAVEMPPALGRAWAAPPRPPAPPAPCSAYTLPLESTATWAALNLGLGFKPCAAKGA